MSRWSPGRVRQVLWRMGTGWMLWPVLTLLPGAYIQAKLKPTGGLLFLAYQFVVLAFCIQAIAWFAIAVRHVKVAVETWQLRVPGCPRTVLLSICSLAIWSVVAMGALLLPWRGAGIHWAEAVVFAIAVPCLAALIDFRRWAWAVAFFLATSQVTRVFVGPQSALVVAGIVLFALLRLWLLARGLRRGACPTVLGQAWYIDRDEARLEWRTRPLSGRATSQHSSSEAMRIMLGPLFALPPVWLFLCLTLPVVMLNVLPIGRLVAVAASWLCAAWFMTLAQRLAALLHEPQGESVELALLPGLGSMMQQRQALLSQALILPLLYGGLWLLSMLAGYWLTGLLAGYLGAQHVARTPTPLELVIAALAPLTVLLLFVSLSLGVVCGRLAPMNAWLRNWAVIVLVPASCTSVQGAAVAENPVGALSAACLLLVLAVMVTYMITDTLHLRRLPRVLCQ